MMVTGKNGRMVVEERGQTKIVEEQPLEAAEGAIARLSQSGASGIALLYRQERSDFSGYDLLQYYERLPKHRIDDLAMNDLQFMFCDSMIVFDRFKQQME